MSWNFKKDSILKNYNEQTPCKEIFQAVCDEIGMYYVEKGWKYARSRPKITLKNDQVKIEIAFWSSGSNIPGDYVNLEILPHISSLELINDLKMKGIKSKGYILSFTELFTERLDNQLEGSKVIINAFGNKIERVDEYNLTPELIYNKNINVYGITENDFMSLIGFIEDKIIVWTEKINNIVQIDTFLKKLTDGDRERLIKKEFGKLINMKFPEYELK